MRFRKDIKQATENGKINLRHVAEKDWKSIWDIWADFNSYEYAQYDKPHNTDDMEVNYD